MKEDYLWDKTGEDKEIAELENTLKSFRSTNSVPPELPAKTFAFDKNHSQNEKPRRFSFQFAFATFACLGLIILSVGIFQVLNVEEQNLAKNTSDISSDETNVEKPAIVKNETVKDEPIKTTINEPIVEKPKFTLTPKEKTRVIKVKKQVREKVKNNPIIARKVEPKLTNEEPTVRTVKLTKEEKEAYETLMKALAITGTQMRIVQEKINGVEEMPTAKKGTR